MHLAGVLDRMLGLGIEHAVLGFALASIHLDLLLLWLAILWRRWESRRAIVIEVLARQGGLWRRFILRVCFGVPLPPVCAFELHLGLGAQCVAHLGWRVTHSPLVCFGSIPGGPQRFLSLDSFESAAKLEGMPLHALPSEALVTLALLVYWR